MPTEPTHATNESIEDAFQREVAEITTKLAAPRTSLLGFSIVVVVQEGRKLSEACVLERHDAGLADDALREGLEASLEKLG